MWRYISDFKTLIMWLILVLALAVSVSPDDDSGPWVQHLPDMSQRVGMAGIPTDFGQLSAVIPRDVYGGTTVDLFFEDQEGTIRVVTLTYRRLNDQSPIVGPDVYVVPRM